MHLLRKYWYLVLSVAIFAAGAISAALGIPALKKQGERLNLAASLLSRMTAVQERAGSVERALTVLNELDRKNPEDLDILIHKSGLAEKIGDRRNTVDRIDEQWSVLVSELSFPDIILSDIESFISACSESRPPWVAEKVTIRSSPFESGRGQVSLTMQALRGKSD